MPDKIQAIRGMNDVLPNQTSSWRLLEGIFTDCLAQYGYQEIRFPLLESTQLFKRTIGEVTDIVEKEMYTFNDLNGDSITLRPEGTAGCLRACLEHGLLYNQQQKLWYQGPMFRHERPQKGRYRQFNQFGVEAIGIPGLAAELELIAISRRLWRILGVDQVVHLQLNSLGELHERQHYKEKLTAYFNVHFDQLDEDSQRRLDKNPLRILDSKNSKIQELLFEAPKLIDFLGSESKTQFERLCDGLKQLNIPYVINPFLVRGLDYYGHTVFEWVTDQLGSQGTVCAGGRYDALVEHLGGTATPAVGFALGIERLLLLLDHAAFPIEAHVQPSMYVIAVGDLAMQHALLVAEQLRDCNPRWQVMINTTGGSFKSQFKKADKSGAELALILGDDEVKQQQISIKNLRTQTDQITVDQHQLSQYIHDYFNK